MRQFTKGIDLVEAQIEFFRQAGLSAENAHEQLATAALQDWIELCSGALTPNQTRGAFARGSTATVSTAFGRRRGLSARKIANRGLKDSLVRGSVPLLPINVQSRRLLNSIKLRPGPSGAGRQVFDVGPDPEAAGASMWVLVPTGTRKMIARGIWAEIQRRFRARNKAFEEVYLKGQGV